MRRKKVKKSKKILILSGASIGVVAVGLSVFLLLYKDIKKEEQEIIQKGSASSVLELVDEDGNKTINTDDSAADEESENESQQDGITKSSSKASKETTYKVNKSKNGVSYYVNKDGKIVIVPDGTKSSDIKKMEEEQENSTENTKNPSTTDDTKTSEEDDNNNDNSTDTKDSDSPEDTDTEDDNKDESEEKDTEKKVPDEIRNVALIENLYVGGTTSNKEYKKTVSENVISELLEQSKGFMAAFNNISYKDINTKSGYEKKKKEICKYFNSEVVFYDDSNVKYSMEDYIDTWLNLVKDTKSIIKAEFVTDDTLIYGYPFTIVRGAFEFKIEQSKNPAKLAKFNYCLSSNKNKLSAAKVGTTYHSGVELQFANSGNKSEWDSYSDYVSMITVIYDAKEGGLK